MIVYLNEQDLAFAQQCEDGALARLADKGPSYTGLMTPGRFKLAIEGELAFLRCCHELGIPAFWKMEEWEAMNQDYDFDCMIKGNPMRVEVKTRMKYGPLLQPVKKKHCLVKSDMMVFCRVHGVDAICVEGFVSTRYFLEHAAVKMFKVESYCLDPSYLRPLTDLTFPAPAIYQLPWHFFGPPALTSTDRANHERNIT